MLNLPQPGLATGILRKAWGESIDDKNDKETARTRMIGNALLQQAKEGNMNDSGFSFLNENFPEMAGSIKQANEKAKSENVLRLEKMKLEKIELGGKLFNQKIEASIKFSDEAVYGEAGREFQKAALEEAKTYAKMMGKEFNVSAAMDAIDIKKAQKKFNFEVLQENIKGIQSGATPERIAGVERNLSDFASKNKGDPAISMMEKQIATAKTRLAKETERKENLETKKAEEARSKQAEIEKENRNRKIKMTNPKNGRTVEISATQQQAFEKAGWELGGQSKTPSEKGEVTWTTATNNLSKRFGSQDAMGNIIITKELQDKHKLSQKKLVELKKQGMDPLEAINTAEDYANKVEEKYQEYMKAAKLKRGKDRQEAENKTRAAFKKKYGYIPR